MNTYIDFSPFSRNPQDFETPHINRIAQSFSAIKAILQSQVLIRGVDLSHWNDDVNFDLLVESGIQFVILKVSEGIDFIDPRFEANWKAAQERDLIVLLYHFFRSNLSGLQQASYCSSVANEFLSVVDNKTIIFADIETEDGTTNSIRIERAREFLETIEAENIQAGMYSSPYFWSKLMTPVPSWTNDYWQWDAHWTPASMPALPIGWTQAKTKFWQYGIYPTHSWVAPIYGAGTVDANYFFGTIDELYSLLGLSMTCCEDLQKQIALLQEQLTIHQTILAEQQARLDRQSRRINKLETDVPLLDTRILTIETLVQSIKDVVCK